MLDSTLFSISLPSLNVKEKDSLILTGCDVNFSDNSIYSELEELSFYCINSNDYGCNRIDIELSFENNFTESYHVFHAHCISIRADNKIICKINGDTNPFSEHYTKIKRNGKMALGISYYFEELKKEILVRNCNEFCIEGFLSIDKKTNVFGFMCHVVKDGDTWTMKAGNTYRIYKHTNIYDLMH